MTKVKKDWREDLLDKQNSIGGEIRLICDEIYVKGVGGEDHSKLKMLLIKNLKRFISQLLKKQQEEMGEAVRKGITVELWSDGCLQDLDRVIDNYLKQND